MRRGAKRAKPTAKGRGAASPQGLKVEDSRVRDLEKRLAEALKREEEARTREVAALKREAESLEQQTATSEILKVIADTPTDVTPVFEAILRSAVRLFNAYGGAIRRFDGELVHLGAVTSPNREADDRLRRMFPHPPDREWASEHGCGGRSRVDLYRCSSKRRPPPWGAY